MTISKDRLVELLNIASGLPKTFMPRWDGETAAILNYDELERFADLILAEAAQREPTEPLGYAVFRDGKQVGIERSIKAAAFWVNAEFVPLFRHQPTSAPCKFIVTDHDGTSHCRLAQSDAIAAQGKS